MSAVLQTVRLADQPQALGALARACLIAEVETHPKPGLVSHRSQGSHQDMDADLLRRSAGVLEPFFAELAAAGRRGTGMAELRRIGLKAEAVMLAETDGVNTHRGAIFGLGLLCAAAGLREARGEDGRLGPTVAARWGQEIATAPENKGSHGALACQRFRVGGARAEAATGFPSAYGIGLPALRAARLLTPGDAEAARVQACMALIAALEDTNLLHRGGAEGLAFAQSQAMGFLRMGGVGQPGWRGAAEAVHAGFVRRNLSPGGAADLLAITLFLDAVEEG